VNLPEIMGGCFEALWVFVFVVWLEESRFLFFFGGGAKSRSF